MAVVPSSFSDGPRWRRFSPYDRCHGQCTHPDISAHRTLRGPALHDAGHDTNLVVVFYWWVMARRFPSTAWSVMRTKLDVRREITTKPRSHEAPSPWVSVPWVQTSLHAHPQLFGWCRDENDDGGSASLSTWRCWRRAPPVAARRCFLSSMGEATRGIYTGAHAKS
jgi:hypothetical protein